MRWGPGLCPQNKRERESFLHLRAEERLREDTARRWPSVSQEKRPPHKLDFPGLHLQNQEEISFCCRRHAICHVLCGGPNTHTQAHTGYTVFSQIQDASTL